MEGPGNGASVSFFCPAGRERTEVWEQGWVALRRYARIRGSNCLCKIKPIILLNFSSVTGEKTFLRTPIRGLKMTVLISSDVTRRALLNLYSSYAPTINWFCSSFLFKSLLRHSKAAKLSVHSTFQNLLFCFISITCYS